MPDARVSGTLVIGTQLAQAREAQQRHDHAHGKRQSALADLSYSDRACRLWRWTDSPSDSSIEKVAAGFADASGEERFALRNSLTMDDFYTLLTFARRCALAALRSGDASRIQPAFNAMAMIQLARVDRRDLLVANWLVRYVGQRLNMPVDKMATQAAQMADPQTAKALLQDRTRRIDLAKSCGLREVETQEGLAFFQTGYERFSPKADLAGIAYATAVALEDNGYEIGTVEVACKLPLIWLGSDERSPFARMVQKFSGCVIFHGVPYSDPKPRSSGQSLLVFLAEAANESDACNVAAAADSASNSQHTEIGWASGRLCAVVIQSSWIADTLPMEDVRSLARLRLVFERLLA